MGLPRWLLPHRSDVRDKRLRIIVTAGLAIGCFVFFHSYLSPESVFSPPRSNRPSPIPNIVHFTQLQKDDNARFHVSFQAYLSMYSALSHLQPTQIYVHTDFNDTMISQAREEGSKWTRMLLANPKVALNRVRHYTHANGHVIENVEAKSDLVRWEQLYVHGGIYMDFDTLTLRDARPLREAGFNNVMGRQRDGAVIAGCFMSQPRSALTYIMKGDQWAVFDGRWETHSIKLVTAVSERLVRTPNEILILDAAAMTASGYSHKEIEYLYSEHGNTVPLLQQVNDPVEDPLARWYNKTRTREWEMDYSASYFLHGYKPHDGWEIPAFKGVSVKYVLARNSNFALAAWPVVQRGLREGVFLETDDEL